jgi:hypothetical protein
VIGIVGVGALVAVVHRARPRDAVVVLVGSIGDPTPTRCRALPGTPRCAGRPPHVDPALPALSTRGVEPPVSVVEEEAIPVRVTHRRESVMANGGMSWSPPESRRLEPIRQAGDRPRHREGRAPA